ncbi:hypothetical protein ACH5RR_034777, partial [Cinchona calisaya]
SSFSGARHILETLTYLARNHPFAAKILLEFRLPWYHQISTSDAETNTASGATANDVDGSRILGCGKRSSLVAILNGKDRHILSDEDSTTVSLVWDINSALEPLWLELSTCLNKMENYSDSAPDLLRSPILSISGVMHPLPAGSQNILP